MMNETKVLRLWRLQLQTLGIDGDRHGNTQAVINIASHERFNKRVVVAEAKLRFSPDWWDGFIIQDVAYIGDLHMIDKIPLYEHD